MYEIAHTAMQSSNFDATAFQNSIYGNSSGFDPGPFKVSHAGYSPEPNSDAGNFYQSYISSPSAYPQAMSGYGCREPPSYVETSFFRHPSPSFMQNFSGGVNYYKMATNRQMDVNEYSASGLMAMAPNLVKQGDPFSYNTLQLEHSFNSDAQTATSSGNVNSSIAGALTATELPASLIGQNHIQHHHLHNPSQSQQQSDHQEQKSPSVHTELHSGTYQSSTDAASLYGAVKLEDSAHCHSSISSYSKQPFDSAVTSLAHQAGITLPTCSDIKPSISTSKTQSPQTQPSADTQHNTTLKQENFILPTQSESPRSFNNHQGSSKSSSSPNQENAPSSTKERSGTNIDNNGTSEAPKTSGTEESGEGKPTMSYIALIAKAILESDQRRLNLGSIYHWIEKHYPFYKNKGQGWRNSVRHNLSLNDCFIKAGRCEDGKGNYWAIHPANIQDFIRGDFRQRRRSRRRGRKKECDLGLYHVPNGYLQPPAPPLTSGMALNPAALSSIYSPYTEAERRAYRLDEALLRQSMNNPFVKWYHQQQPGVPTTPGYGVPTSPHHGCSAPGLYANSTPMQWPHQTYAPDSSAQNMYPALNSTFPR